MYHIAFKIPSTKKPVNKVEWKWKKNWMQAIVWSLKTPLKLFKMWVCNSIFIQIIIIQMSGWTRSVEFDYSISMEVDNNAIVWWILKCVALHCSELDHVIDWMRHYELSAANWQLSNIVPFRLCHWPMATCFCFYFKIQQLFLSVAFAAQVRICAYCQMWYQAMPCHGMLSLLNWQILCYNKSQFEIIFQRIIWMRRKPEVKRRGNKCNYAETYFEISIESICALFSP